MVKVKTKMKSNVKSMKNLPLNQIICGNCIEVMRNFPDESIDFVMFSPPYFGLRNYGKKTVTEWSDGWKGQLGLEPSWQMYVNHLVEVCREVKRILKKTGSFYLNLGDTYAGSLQGYGQKKPSKTGFQFIGNGKYASSIMKPPQAKAKGYKRKCLMGIPWRVAFALIDDGWILRNDIIWYKPNHMPESVKDRLAKSYEHIFHFVKSIKYYYNLDMIREPHKTEISNSFCKKGKYIETKRGNRDYKNLEKFIQQQRQWYSGRHENNPKGKNPGDIVTTFSYGLRIVYEKMNEVDASYQSKFKHDDYGQTLQSFAREEKIAKIRKASREVAKQLFPNNERLQQEFINWVHDHAGNPKGKNPGDIIKFDSKFLKYNVKTASPGARARRAIVEGKLTTHIKKKILNVGEYLKQKKKESGYTMKELAELTGIKKTTLEHYFRTDFSGQALPNREIWSILKPILNLGEYDDFIDEEIKSALPQPHPYGRNPGDFWSIPTRPFKGKHFAVYPIDICLRPILSSCPPDGIVLDPMCGSGTTLLCCELINRKMWYQFKLPVNNIAQKTNWNLKWIGIDINPEYCEISRKRLSQFPSKLDVFLTKRGR